MGLMLSNHKTRKVYCAAMEAGFLGWLFIHYFFCQLIYQYAWGIQNGDAMALQAADAVYRAFAVPFYGWYLLMDIPFLIHLVAIIRGNSLLPRRAAALHPLPVILLLRVLTNVLPQTPFVYGLGLGAMNEGMIIWFIAALFAGELKRRPD